MPGERHSSVKLVITCDTGYLNNNSIENIFCVNGDWSESMPTCVRDFLGFCTLPTDDLKVEYRCLSFPGTLERSWECESLVSTKTLVKPICRFPGYFSLSVLPEMHCRDGMWDYNPICKPACGLTTQHLPLEGTSGNYLQLPWHTVIYMKRTVVYSQACGGSLLTANKVISAATCFHDFHGELLPASNFVVAVNKIYSKYKDARDRNSQYSDITDIKIPSNYRGKPSMRFENNIAVLIVKTLFNFHLSVRPVCLDFENNLDRTQLTEKNSGKIARWRIAYPNDKYKVLDVVDVSYTKNEDCENMLWTDSRFILAKDNFCATYNNETWLDSTYIGRGVAFLEFTTQRYYLQGVTSDYFIASDGNTWIILYTSIVEHESFIKQHL